MSIGTEIVRLASPQMLLLLGVVPLLVGLYVYRIMKGGAAIRISTVSGVLRTRKTFRHWLRHFPFVLSMFGLITLILGMSRPQGASHQSNSQTEGIDIMLAVDVSGSMLSRDFQPDRMTAAKETAAKFIVDRPNDRIGIVVFAGESFTQSPLTTDKVTLQNLLSRVRSGIIEDGTAIGNGLATAVNRLRESDAESKVVILLTDGVNNTGQIAPLTAAEIAQTLGIRVYTIGIGSKGTAPTPALDMWGRIIYVQAPVEIDEEILTQIAAMTGGEYFRATDNRSLEQVYERINALEKTIIETNEYVRYEELYSRFVLWGLGFLLGAFLLGAALRRVP